MTACRVPHCGRRAVAKRLCSRHWQSMRKYGRLRPLSTLDRFRMKCVILPSGCIEWTGAKSSGGYGNFNGRVAHRVAYEFAYGPVPDELQLDHVCHDPALCSGGPRCAHRACVNPDHLEPVTPRANTLRSWSPSAVNAAKSECVNGHPFDGGNTYRRGSGSRGCRACHRNQVREAARRGRPQVVVTPYDDFTGQFPHQQGGAA